MRIRGGGESARESGGPCGLQIDVEDTIEIAILHDASMIHRARSRATGAILGELTGERRRECGGASRRVHCGRSAAEEMERRRQVSAVVPAAGRTADWLAKQRDVR